MVCQSISNHVREPVIPCRVIQKGRGLIEYCPRPLSRIKKSSTMESSGLSDTVMWIPFIHTLCVSLRLMQVHVQKRMNTTKLHTTRRLVLSSHNSSSCVTILRSFYFNSWLSHTLYDHPGPFPPTPVDIYHSDREAIQRTPVFLNLVHNELYDVKCCTTVCIHWY